MESKIPRLETERLILRAHEIKDFETLWAIWANPVTVRYTSGHPSTEAQSWARLLNYRGHWALIGYGYWAVEEKSSRKYIGEIGFADFKRDMTPSINGIPELGWILAPEVHGLGYATEGVQAALDWGREYLPSKKVACIINTKNTASIRVADKCKFIKSPHAAQYMGEETLLYFQDLL